MPIGEINMINLVIKGCQLFLKKKNENKSSFIILSYLYSFYFPLYSMY